MGNQFVAMEALQRTVRNAVEGTEVNGRPIRISTGIDWPAKETFEKIQKKNQAIISITDMATRGNGYALVDLDTRQSVITYPLGITSDTNKKVIPPGGTATCEIILDDGMTQVEEFDAIAIVVHKGDETRGTVAKASKAGEDRSALAARFALEINKTEVYDERDSPVSDWINATVSGETLTFTNLTSESIRFEVNCGNVEDRITELGRESMAVMVTVHSGTKEARRAIGIKLQELFGSLTKEIEGPIQVEDDYPVRVCTSRPPVMRRDDFLADLYRHDFHLDVGYTLTRIDRAWSVLIPLPSYEFL